MKEFYSKTEARKIMGVGPVAFDKMVEDGSLVAAGGRVSGASMEKVLGHPIDQETAVNEPEGPRELTKEEKLKADTAEKEATLQNIEVTARLEGWEQERAELGKREAAVDRQEEAVAEAREALVTQDAKVKHSSDVARQDITKAAAAIKEAAVAKANLIEEGKAEAKRIRDAAEEALAGKRNVLDVALEAAKSQIARAEKIIFDGDQLRILQARVKALPERVRGKYFPIKNEAYIPLPEDKAVPVPVPKPQEPARGVLVDRGFTLSEETGHKVLTWAIGILLAVGAVAAAIWLLEPGVKSLFSGGLGYVSVNEITTFQVRERAQDRAMGSRGSCCYRGQCGSSVVIGAGD